MAAKRLAQTTINWTAFAERVPENQKLYFLALRGKTDGYLRRVNANPAEPPKLDFSAYKNKVPVAGLVESLQKQYEAFKVPYPSENVTPKINEEEQRSAKEVQEFIVGSNQRIKEYQQKLAKWDSVMPYEQMTMEDFYEAHPELAIDPINKPTLWPHDPQSQPGYDWDAHEKRALEEPEDPKKAIKA